MLIFLSGADYTLPQPIIVTESNVQTTSSCCAGNRLSMYNQPPTEQVGAENTHILEPTKWVMSFHIIIIIIIYTPAESRELSRLTSRVLYIKCPSWPAVCFGGAVPMATCHRVSPLWHQSGSEHKYRTRDNGGGFLFTRRSAAVRFLSLRLGGNPLERYNYTSPRDRYGSATRKCVE